MSDHREIYRLHTEGQTQYVYFLLGSTGAALGYALQQMDGVLLSGWASPALLALLFWLGSFYYGCKRINSSHRLLSANFNFLQLKDGTHPNQPGHPVLLTAIMEGVQRTIDDAARESSKFLNCQFLLLGLGAASFVLWRITDMWRLTYGS